MLFGSSESFDMLPDKGIRTKDAGVFRLDSAGILKSICIYGPNNSGKSCLIHAAECLRDLILGHVNERYMRPNLNTGSSIIGLGAEICDEEGEACKYSIKYDIESKRFVFESLLEIDESVSDRFDRRREKEIFILDRGNDICRCIDGEEVCELMKAAPEDRLLIHSLRDRFEKYADALEDFASSVDIVDMNTITLEKTTRALKYGTPLKERILQIIRQAQLFINDYAYVPDNGDGSVISGKSGPQEITQEDYRCLYSYHNGTAYRSIECDSVGMLKTVALAGWIADAYDNGRILLIDDLDGLYFRLAQALTGLFSCDGNISFSQLIFTTHDFTILDFKNLFRRDQIKFMDRCLGETSVSWMRRCALDRIRSISDSMKTVEELNFEACSRPAFFDFVGNEPEDE